MYFNNQPPTVIVTQQESTHKEKRVRKMSQPVLLSLALAYAQKCVDLDIDAEEFTSKFIHIYSNLKTLNDGKRKENVNYETKPTKRQQ